MLAAGRLRELIVIERHTATIDTYGGESEGVWDGIYTCRAEVRYGTGEERRQVAQEAGSQVASFVVRRNPTTDSFTIKDRILFMGETWDIKSLAPAWAGATEITATRAT